MQGRVWLVWAAALLWMPLVMAGGAWLLAGRISAPGLMAALGVACLAVSLVLLWLGIFQTLRGRIRVADLLWLAVYGVGALLYGQLIAALRT